MYTNSEQKQFSRWKTAISLMQEEIGIVYGGNQEAAFKEIDCVYTAVSPFVSVLQKQKKNRKSKSSNKSSANKIAPANVIADV